jgi:hypothetical protein
VGCYVAAICTNIICVAFRELMRTAGLLGSVRPRATVDQKKRFAVCHAIGAIACSKVVPI